MSITQLSLIALGTAGTLLSCVCLNLLRRVAKLEDAIRRK